MSIDITTLALAKEYTNRMVGSGGTGSGVDGGYYTPGVTQPTTDTMQILFAPSKSDMPAINPITVNLPVSEGSGQNPALTANERSTLIAVINAIGVFNVPNGNELVDAFNAAWGGSGDSGGEEPGVTISQSGGTLAVAGVPAITSITQAGHVLVMA